MWYILNEGDELISYEGRGVANTFGNDSSMSINGRIQSSGLATFFFFWKFDIDKNGSKSRPAEKQTTALKARITSSMASKCQAKNQA